jgi:hypothetical protein
MQRSSFRYPQSGGQTKCYQIHHGRFLPRCPLFCNSQTGSSGLVDQALEPESGSSHVYVVFYIVDDNRHIRVCRHLVRAVHAFAFTVGLLGRGHMLV